MCARAPGPLSTQIIGLHIPLASSKEEKHTNPNSLPLRIEKLEILLLCRHCLSTLSTLSTASSKKTGDNNKIASQANLVSQRLGEAAAVRLQLFAFPLPLSGETYCACELKSPRQTERAPLSTQSPILVRIEDAVATLPLLDVCRTCIITASM